MLSRRVVSLAVAVALMFVTSTVLGAVRGGGPTLPKGEPITPAEPIKGTVDLTPQGPKIAAGNDSWLIMANSDLSRIRVKGAAQIEYVRSGQHIQFNAMYDAKTHKIKDPLTKIKIFTPSPNFSPGATPDVNVTGAAASGDFKAMVFTGQIRTVLKGNKLLVTVPSIKSILNVELTESVTVDVDLAADPAIIKQGDTIDVKTGQKWTEQKCVRITSADIIMAEPLTGPVKKKPKGAGKGAEKPAR